jgi:hypothetical protein
MPLFPNEAPFQISCHYPVSRIRFVHIPAGVREARWHIPPGRVLAVWLDGIVEFETTDGEVRRVSAGSSVLQRRDALLRDGFAPMPRLPVGCIWRRRTEPECKRNGEWACRRRWRLGPAHKHGQGCNCFHPFDSRLLIRRSRRLRTSWPKKVDLKSLSAQVSV